MSAECRTRGLPRIGRPFEDSWATERRKGRRHEDSSRGVSQELSTASCFSAQNVPEIKTRCFASGSCPQPHPRTNMVTQRKVLTWIARQTAKGPAVSADDIGREFRLSIPAAAGHVQRLWRNDLIETTSRERSDIMPAKRGPSKRKAGPTQSGGRR